MAFTPINPADVEVGKPTKKELFELSRTNLDDHESRIGNIESGNSRVIVFNDLVLNAANYASTATIQTIDVFVAPADFTISTAIITVFDAGVSGSYEIDVIKSTTPDRTAGSTIFSTRPSVPFSDGDNSKSSNTVFITQEVTQNDYLFLDISAFQAGANGRFQILMYGELGI